MADRTVTVGLQARVAGFVRDIGLATSAVSAFESRLASADAQSGSTIDRLSGRVAIFMRLAGAFGPGFIPVLTAAVPLVTGLATQLGFLVAAGGATALALNGVGGALDALNAYQLEKTPANFKKLQESLRGLGPEARGFVVFLDELGPKLQKLRTAAQAGALPGFAEGIDSVMERLPQMRKFVSEMAEASGELVADTGAALASGDWDEFFDFLIDEGKPKLLDFGHTLGNLAEAGANLFMGLDPLTDDFSTGLLKWSQNLADASENLEDSEKFREFLAYVQETGPEALETLGALADGILQMGEAAAPLGGPVLDGVEMFADAVATIADSPLGTPIMGMVTALSALNLVLGATSKLQTSTLSSGIFKGGLLSGAPGTMRAQLGMIQQVPTAYRKMADAQRELASAQAAQAKASIRAREASFVLNARPNDQIALMRMTARTEESLKAVRATAAAESKLAISRQRISGTLRESVAGFTKGAAAAGGFALAMSPIPEKMGLANTATMAMMGSLAGPWGTAIGGAVGLTMDLTGANDDLVDSLERSGDLLANSNDYTAMQEGLARSKAELDEFRSGIAPWHDLGLGEAITKVATHPMMSLRRVQDEITGESEKQTAEYREQVTLLNRMGVASSELAKAMGAEGMFGESSPGAMATLKDRLAAIERAQPAMDKLGITLQDIANADGLERKGLLWQIASEVERMDSTQGRLEGVADAISGLEAPMESTADAADRLRSALDALLSPGQELSDATDAWNESIRNLDDNLAENGRSLTANTDAADMNRNAISGMKDDLVDLLVAQRKQGAGSEKLTKTLKNGVQTIIDTGREAGLSEKEIRSYLKTLGLSPKMVKTIIEAVGVDKARGGVKGLIGDMNDLDKKTANPKVNAETALAMTRLIAVQAALNAIRSKSVNVNVTRTGVVGLLGGADGMTVPGFANGGSPGFTVPGQRQPYGDKVLARNAMTGGFLAIAPGEEVVTNRDGQSDMFRPELKDINSGMSRAEVFSRMYARGLADGGSAGRPARAGAYAGGGAQSSPRISVGGPSVRVFIDGNEVRAVVRSELADNEAWEGGLDR